MNISIAAVTAIYVIVAFIVCIVFYIAVPLRPNVAPWPKLAGNGTEGCINELECPPLTFCYRELPKNLFDVTAGEDEILEQVCGCYGMFGEAGKQPMPGGVLWNNSKIMYDHPMEIPTDGYCQQEEGYKGLLKILTYILFAANLVVNFALLKTMYQLNKVKALLFNASGITIAFVTAGAIMMNLLVLVYVIEINRLSTPVYAILDSVRPNAFGFFAFGHCGGLLQVSIMWADVYTKSQKMGAKNDNIGKLKKFVNVLLGLSFVIIIGGLLAGAAIAVAGWVILILLGVAVAYWRGGHALAGILMPKGDPDAPGATSARQAATEILNTGKFISFVNVLFVMGLAGYSVTVQRPATGPAAFMFVLFFLFCALAHQIRLMDYVKFGARKKLLKAGFGAGFRASAMSTMTSSVAPEDDKGGVANPSSSVASTQSNA